MPRNANNGTLLIMAITKALIAIVLVTTFCYLVATGRSLDPGLTQLILLVLGAYFGFSAKVYYESVRNQRTARQSPKCPRSPTT